MNEYWGYHLILDVSGCDKTLMSNKQNVYNWITNLVKDIQMQPVGEPDISYTAAHDINKAGFTAIQIIVTSSIVAHFIDSTGQIYVDVFSCKLFDQNIVKQSLINYFSAKKMRETYLTRQAD
jgi:S-adenosylmethionine/arginine decarboxylase-like enzyme